MMPGFFGDCCSSPMWLWLSWSDGMLWAGLGDQIYDRTLAFARDDTATEVPLFLGVRLLSTDATSPTQLWIPGCYYNNSGTLKMILPGAGLARHDAKEWKSKFR